MIRTALAACLLCLPVTAMAQEWQALPPPLLDTEVVIDHNPLQGFYSWHDGGIIPVSPPSREHYMRFTWADLEPREGVYDFSKLEQALADLGPKDRLAFGVLPMDTCCSGHNGLDVPGYLKDHLAKGFWMQADPGNYGHVDKVYVPDWNDPYFLERWRKLWAAIGAHWDGNPRIAWVDLRGYGNWGEGHLAGANAYHWSQFPYDDATVNVHGAERGSEASRFAIVDAMIDAMPHTQLLAMTDDKAVLVHALSRSPAIGMRRDSWGADMFGGSLLEGVAEADKPLILERWKTAPFIVESYGWTKVFEAGLDGITKQVEDYHISAIGNGNFNVRQWSDLPPEQQAALIRAGNRAGYRYVPVAVAYRTTVSCPLELKLDLRNDGVAPSYEGWKVHVWLAAAGASGEAIAPEGLAAILPGETQSSDLCFTLAVPAGDYQVTIRIEDAGKSGRSMTLPVGGGSGDDRYGLGTASLRPVP